MKQKNMWTKEQLEAAAALAQELQAQADPQKTVEQNMQEALLGRVDDIDAQQAVADLCSGIRSFHDTLEQAQDQGLSALVDQKLEGILSDRTEEEQIQLLYGMLSAFAQASDRPAPSSPFQVEELKHQVREYLCEYSVLHLGSEGMELLLREFVKKDLEELERVQAKANQEQYIALAFYLQKLQGELDAVPDELSAQEIGVLTAASCTANKTVLGGLLGKIDWETVKRTLVLIAGAALLAIISIAFAKIAIFAGTLTFWIVKGIVGMSVIGTVIAALFGFGVVSDIVGAAVEIGRLLAELTHVDEAVKTGTSILGKWFQETVRPKAVQFWHMVKDFFGQEESIQTEVQEEAQEPQEEPDYTPA